MASPFANMLPWTNYGEIGTVDNLNGGPLEGFAFSGPHYETIQKTSPLFRVSFPAPFVFGNATCNSIVELLPTGLQTKSRLFACDANQATWITNGL